jgi:hypothetical protein
MQVIMAIPHYDFLKQFSVSHEYYHADDNTSLNSLCFSFHLLGCLVITTISYFPLNHVEVWTAFVWLMIGTVNMLWPSAIILCKRRVLCVDFLLY